MSILQIKFDSFFDQLPFKSLTKWRIPIAPSLGTCWTIHSIYWHETKLVILQHTCGFMIDQIRSTHRSIANQMQETHFAMGIIRLFTATITPAARITNFHTPITINNPNEMEFMAALHCWFKAQGINNTKSINKKILIAWFCDWSSQSAIKNKPIQMKNLSYKSAQPEPQNKQKERGREWKWFVTNHE